MKAISGCRYAVAMIAILGMIFVAPARLEGAEARATVSAEVVNPALIDAARILAGAAADAEGELDGQTDQRQVAPQIQVLVVDGVTFLRIDYN